MIWVLLGVIWVGLGYVAAARFTASMKAIWNKRLTFGETVFCVFLMVMGAVGAIIAFLSSFRDNVGFVWKWPNDFLPVRPIRPKKQTEPIVGYRVWELHNGQLRSMMYPFYWPSRRASQMEVGSKGIHAVKEESQLRTLMGMYGATVAGSVYLWGNVEEHEHGYLAEKAYPKELWVAASTDPITIMTLEKNYGVPVSIREDLAFGSRAGDFITYVFGRIPAIPLSLAQAQHTQIQYFQYDDSTQEDQSAK